MQLRDILFDEGFNIVQLKLKNATLAQQVDNESLVVVKGVGEVFVQDKFNLESVS